MSDSEADWLETEEPTAHLPAVVEIPADPVARLVLIEDCWATLTQKQKLFLATLRDCRFNARAAARKLGLTSPSAHKSSLSNPKYLTVFRAWQRSAGDDALDRDRLLARHDDIVETALTPKPILFQGEHTGFEEVEVGVAARANEALMKAAGLFPRENTEVNVGVAFTPPHVEIEVVKAAGTTIDAQATVVEVSPALPEDEDDAERGISAKVESGAPGKAERI